MSELPSILLLLHPRVNASQTPKHSTPTTTTATMPFPSPSARLAVPAASAVLLLFFAATASAANFTCAATKGTTCQSAFGYAVPNATTYGDLASRFNTTTVAGILGANNLPAETPATTRVPAKTVVHIPFRCRCAGNGVGQSDHQPVYTVQPDDGLFHIATDLFGAFVTYPEIATANSIPDPNKILVGQKLWIPLPCSCDKVEGADVMHFAYSVAGGQTTSGIAAMFGVSESNLLNINKITDPKSLQKDQILDVPLPVCRSAISNTSADHDLVLANGTYALTAQDCIKCSCSASTYQLDCSPVQGKTGCPVVPMCGTLKLGQTNGTGCGSTTCAYSGYSSSSSLRIETTLVNNQTTPACQSNSGGAARSSEFAGSMWRMSAISFHMVLIFICFL